MEEEWEKQSFPSALLWRILDTLSSHPEWREEVEHIDAASLMTEERFNEIRDSRWKRIKEEAQRLGRWKYWPKL